MLEEIEWGEFVRGMLKEEVDGNSISGIELFCVRTRDEWGLVGGNGCRSCCGVFRLILLCPAPMYPLSLKMTHDVSVSLGRIRCSSGVF